MAKKKKAEVQTGTRVRVRATALNPYTKPGNVVFIPKYRADLWIKCGYAEPC